MLMLCQRRIKIRRAAPLTTRDRPELRPRRKRGRSCRRHISARLIRCKALVFGDSRSAAEAPLRIRRSSYR
jgi:hypothetical protein